MIYLALITKYWRFIVGGLFVVAVLVGLNRYAHKAYERGKADGITVMQKQVNDTEQKLARAEQKAYQIANEYEDYMTHVAEQYQDRKAEQQVKEKIKYVQVQKIVEKPVYRECDCLDERGLSEIRSAIKGN